MFVHWLRTQFAQRGAADPEYDANQAWAEFWTKVHQPPDLARPSPVTVARTEPDPDGFLGFMNAAIGG